jgi:hypothetical protein
MMTEKPQPKLPSGQSVKWKEQETPTIYANIMGFGMSPFDISLVFGEIAEATVTEVNAIPRVRVTLAPEQAANLVKLLGLAVGSYVENNGQLRTTGAVDLDLLEAQVKAQKVTK